MLIFYSQLNTPLITAGKYPLSIKAALLDTGSLKITKTVEIKKLRYFENFSSSTDKTYNDNAAFFYSGHSMKMKYLNEEKKFILFFSDYIQKNKEPKKYYMLIIDEELKIIFDKEDDILCDYLGTVGFLDFYYHQNKFYVAYQTSFNTSKIGEERNLYREACYYGEYTTILRTYDISNSKRIDKYFDKSFHFIKLARFIFDKVRNAVIIGGVYSTLWDSKIDGGFFAKLIPGSYNPDPISIKDFESTDYISYNFNRYKEREKESKKDNQSQSSCYKPKVTNLFTSISNNGTIDFIFEVSIFYSFRYGGILCINLNPDGSVNYNYIPKEQRMLNPADDEDYISYYGTGAFATYQNNKLVVFHNDNLLNTNIDEVPAINNFDKKSNWGLFQVTLDENRKIIAKTLLIDNASDKYIADTRRFWPGRENDIYFMAGTIKKGAKEFRLGVIHLNE